MKHFGGRLILLTFFIVTQGFIFAQKKIATLEITTGRENTGLVVPFHIDLDAITSLADSTLSLFEISGNSKSPVEYQLENKGARMMYWLVAQDGKKKIFELSAARPGKMRSQFHAEKKDGILTLSGNNKRLLQYNYKTVYPPAGVDTIFKRSGFIHPLWSPRGQELTRISPPDHYHHFGLWNPWTMVLIESDTIDFWNLASKKGTVRFANFVSITEGPVYAEYQALHEHIYFKNGEEITAINELQTVRVYQPQENQAYYIIDLSIQLNNPLQQAIVLEEYRYGGLGWRATGKWDKDNSETLTSEGKTRKDADGSKARWCLVQGSLDEDYGGMLMMSFPTNYNFPEPLRVWPENMNGRGDVFANFSPTKDKDWILEPGRNYVLKYRLLVYNGHLPKVKAEASWQYFANPATVTIKK